MLLPREKRQKQKQTKKNKKITSKNNLNKHFCPCFEKLLEILSAITLSDQQIGLT